MGDMVYSSEAYVGSYFLRAGLWEKSGLLREWPQKVPQGVAYKNMHLDRGRYLGDKACFSEACVGSYFLGLVYGGESDGTYAGFIKKMYTPILVI